MTAATSRSQEPSGPGSGLRLTQYAAGGGCACKVPPGELERILTDLPTSREGGDLLVGLDHGDDAAAVRIDGDRAVVATADFFTPVVDDAYDWGRIAAANALSDVYAMGGTPLLAVNLLAWPRDKIPFELAAEVLRGGADICAEAATHLAGGHSIDDPEPKYGLAVTGMADPRRLLRNDAAVAGTPLTLTKPLGLGVLNNRHKATGERFEEAVAQMTTLNREASRAAVEAGAVCATDVTGFGLLGHLMKMARASGVSAVVDAGIIEAGDTLSFETKYHTEALWDFFFVQASTDGGQTWESLPVEGMNAKTLAYVPSDAFGIPGLSNVFQAEYDAGGNMTLRTA